MIAVVLIGCPQLALAYVDPGTGSMLLQGLLAGIAGIVVVLKLYWFRLKHFFLRKTGDDASDRELGANHPKESEITRNPDDSS